MDFYMVVLRIIHIFAGIFWVGSAFFFALILTPVAQKMRSGEIIQSIMTHSRFDIYIAVSAVLTTVAGILLYIQVYSSDWLSTAPGIVLTIGGVAGILAAGHGATSLSRAQQQMMTLAQEIETAGGPPNEQQAAQMTAIQAKIALHTRISLALMIIAVLGMASARYL